MELVQELGRLFPMEIVYLFIGSKYSALVADLIFGEEMSNFGETPTVVYVADVYCGWCWGFKDILAKFEQENRHRVRFTAISGGLFVGPRAAAIAAYPHIPAANARIAELTGAHFGDNYLRLLEEGTIVTDSTDAAIAHAALRAQDPERAIDWVHLLQEKFYVHGRSLSDHETVADIAKANGLDVEKVLAQMTDGTAKAAAKADFAQASMFQVASFPTLLFVEETGAHKLPATGTSVEVLNMWLDDLLVQ
ncbi:DsbA family protein [Duganella hordei]|uniref:DsbA family protein n=1 Tax=Duganella hordei TaxID=2865934 RepID=UPI00333E2AB2